MRKEKPFSNWTPPGIFRLTYFPPQMSHRIREVDGEEEIDELRSLHDECFGGEAPQINDEDVINGWWWIVHTDLMGLTIPIAFAGLKQSRRYDNVGYLYRTGVLPCHRGQGLQKRLIVVRESKAKRLDYIALVTDTTDNCASANNLIHCGFHIHEPEIMWGPNPRTIYWRKWLVPTRRRNGNYAVEPSASGGNPAGSGSGPLAMGSQY